VPPLLGLALGLPAIGRSRLLDDHVLERAASGASELIPRASALDLFQFASGDLARNHELMSRGVLLPWWTDPALKIRFFRPLSSLTHWLDFSLFGGRPQLSYVHSLLWLVLLVALVARLYASVEASRPRVAALAAVLYALSDTNGAVVGWLSNRNALLSAAAVVACLLAQRAARDGASRWLSPLWLALGLLAGELGLSAWAFLVADAIALDRRPWRARLMALAPHLLVTSAWLALHAASGAGTAASGVYLHPLADAGAYLRALPLRAALLIGAAVGPLPAELTFFGSPALLPSAVAAALALVVALVAAQRRALDPVLRFWWLSLLLAVLPVAASFPSDRLLLLVNVAALGIISRVLVAVWETRAPRPAPAASLAAVLLACHALLAPALSAYRAHQMQQLGGRLERAFACLDEIPRLEDKTLVVLGAPVDFFVSYLQLERDARGLPRPAHVYWFSNPEARLDVRASGDHSLSLQRAGGFFVTAAETLYRRQSAPLALGTRVALPDLAVRVRELTAGGAPAQLEVELEQPLGSERYVFLAWHGAEYSRVSPAALTELVIPPAASLLELLSPVTLFER
jgi:hypothetical protein